MKVIYNQIEQYKQKKAEETAELIADIENPSEKVLQIRDKIIARKHAIIDNILANGLDVGTVTPHILPVIDIVLDNGSYNKDIDYAYHGKTFYFLCKDGKKQTCYNADIYLHRAES